MSREEIHKSMEEKEIIDLGQLRREIDRIDKQIVDLFQQRMKISSQVAEYKIDTGKPVLDRQREKEKLEALCALADSDFNRHGIQELFAQIMSMSRKYQYRLLARNGVVTKMDFRKVEKLRMGNVRVVYQGVPGAYSFTAMEGYFGEDVDRLQAATFKEAMEVIAQGRADYAVLPIENSTAGMVSDVYDLLVEYDNYIVAQTAIQINHALLGLPGTQVEDIHNVYSHPQALQQSREFLEEHRDWNQITMANTALAAKKVIELQDRSNGAIASITAARIYGLDVLAEHLNVSNENTTRFIIVSRNCIYTQSANRILVTFEVPHAAGSLYDMLSHFIYNNVNMTKIESRPVKGQNWKYRFFVEMEGTLDRSGIINAIEGLRGEASSLKILGCY